MQEKPILAILSDCVPASQKGDEIKLIVGMEMTKGIVEKNAAYINGLLKRFGADGHIVCTLDRNDAGEDQGGNSVDQARLEAQKAASQLLGIDVKLED